MMGMRMPETCWAVFKRQVINLRSCCIWLVDSFESMMMHGLANPKFFGYVCDRFKIHRICTEVISCSQKFNKMTVVIEQQIWFMERKSRLWYFGWSCLFSVTQHKDWCRLVKQIALCGVHICYQVVTDMTDVISSRSNVKHDTCTTKSKMSSWSHGSYILQCKHTVHIC